MNYKKENSSLSLNFSNAEERMRENDKTSKIQIEKLKLKISQLEEVRDYYVHIYVQQMAA